MPEINDGGPAFPTPAMERAYDPRRYSAPAVGMSLRDWFAGKALEFACVEKGPQLGPDRLAEAATLAYEIADAMLAHRQKGGA